MKNSKMTLSTETMNEDFVKKVESLSGSSVRRCFQCGKCSAGCPMRSFMEHPPNRIVRLLQLGQYERVLVSDPSLRGLRSVRRIHELIQELKLDVARVSLVLARAPDPLPPVLREEISQCGIPWIGTVPADGQIETFDLARKPLTDLPDTSPSVQACERILAVLLDSEPIR